MSKQKLSEAARAARAAYQKEWREQNRDKTKEHQRRYWERKGQELLKQASQ